MHPLHHAGSRLRAVPETLMQVCARPEPRRAVRSVEPATAGVGFSRLAAVSAEVTKALETTASPVRGVGSNGVVLVSCRLAGPRR